jgi:hypothetical protein
VALSHAYAKVANCGHQTQMLKFGGMELPAQSADLRCNLRGFSPQAARVGANLLLSSKSLFIETLQIDCDQGEPLINIVVKFASNPASFEFLRPDEFAAQCS